MATLAPSPDRPEPDGHGSLTVAGYLSASTGLGAAARRLSTGLRKAGLDPDEVDLTSALWQGPASSASNVQEGPGSIIVAVNGPMLPWALLVLGRRRLRGKRIIAHWNWELPVLPSDWDRGFRACHAIWAPSHFAGAAFSRPGSPPVRICPHYVPQPDPAPLSRADFGLPEDAFVVLSVFDATSSLARKNPLAAIEAHRVAFDDRPDRILVIKTHNTRSAGSAWQQVREAISGRPNIRLLTDVIPRRDLWALMLASDVLISLHRAEGFGFTIAEAMAVGRAVIATGWSGNMDFMHGPGTYAVPYSLVPTYDPQETYAVGGAHWAEPDVGTAASILRSLAQKPAHVPQARFPVPDYLNLLRYSSA
ncbi:glycosyltransferase family 4 protein [Roseomonas terrae]|uniref:Glycosyltransferase family 4 protein n=1 Tax=Neoroseomonas terrae TaxID=424799 RepID=A0ABS5EG33_9PROT|nr:glycosyltransferase [Neoroseomonas terrae]MBR0649986.1 glycosyltransferase family 4 protein [Neoroseomonas terrae]